MGRRNTTGSSGSRSKRAASGRGAAGKRGAGKRVGAKGARARRGRASPRGSGAWRRHWLVRAVRWWWPGKATRKRWWRRYRRAPGPVQLVVGIAVLGSLALAVNLAYQVARKPTELFFPVAGVLYKTPAQTWDTYGPMFRRHATATMTPDLLAALAQAEGSGNPVVRTYWRFAWSTRPFEIWRPASSAVGMYQFTDGTFDQARRWCIHHHVPVADGPWDDWRSCWFNALYARVVPSHAAEMASAWLDVQVSRILARRGLAGRASLAQRQQLATLIHLCGAGAGEAFAARGLALSPGQRCGDHSAAGYLARVSALQREFQRLAARGGALQD